VWVDGCSSSGVTARMVFCAGILDLKVVRRLLKDGLSIMRECESPAPVAVLCGISKVLLAEELSWPPPLRWAGPSIPGGSMFIPLLDHIHTALHLGVRSGY
jgi:hypothetical protein